MKNIMLLLILMVSQNILAQTEFLNGIEVANQSMKNNLSIRDSIFKNNLEFLKPVNSELLEEIGDSIDLNFKWIYYIKNVLPGEYGDRISKYSGFISNTKTDKVWSFKYSKEKLQNNYQLSIIELHHNDPLYEYYSFLIKNSENNAAGIFNEIDKIKAEYVEISFTGPLVFEFLYVLDAKKNKFEGYSFILSKILSMYKNDMRIRENKN